MSSESKCPVMSAPSRHFNTGSGANQRWWPNQLNLKPLHQNPPAGNPLGENFNYMADQLTVLLQETAEKATLEKELEVARTIQETLVPPNDEIENDLIRFAGYFEPASQCGGDWWTYHEMVGDKLLVVIGDVTVVAQQLVGVHEPHALLAAGHAAEHG